MGIQEDNPSNRGGGEALSKQIDDQYPSSDEEDPTRGVEGEAVMEREVGSYGKEVGIDVDEILLRKRGVEDEEGALGRVVKVEQRQYELREAETGGENDEATGRILHKVADYLLVKFYHGCINFDSEKRCRHGSKEAGQ